MPELKWPPHSRTEKPSLTLPARFAHRLHIHLHQGVLSSGLLSTVISSYQDLVLVLLVIAQLLSVSDVACRTRMCAIMSDLVK